MDAVALGSTEYTTLLLPLIYGLILSHGPDPPLFCTQSEIDVMVAAVHRPTVLVTEYD